LKTEPPDTGVEVEGIGDLSDGFPLVYESARNDEAFLIELPGFFSIAAAKFFSARPENFFLIAPAMLRLAKNRRKLLRGERRGSPLSRGVAGGW
jgi:hypothetical protein